MLMLMDKMKYLAMCTGYRLLSIILKSVEKEKDGKLVQGFVCGNTRAYTFVQVRSNCSLENRRLLAFGKMINVADIETIQ